MLHIALYEKRIAQFSQKYGLHMNKFLNKSRKCRDSKSNLIQTELDLVELGNDPFQWKTTLDMRERLTVSQENNIP